MPARPGKRQVAATAAPKRGVSRLAKELKLTPGQEGEIREAFEMFVDENEDPDTIPTSSVKKAMLYAFKYMPHAHVHTLFITQY